MNEEDQGGEVNLHLNLDWGNQSMRSSNWAATCGMTRFLRNIRGYFPIIIVWVKWERME